LKRGVVSRVKTIDATIERNNKSATIKIPVLYSRNKTPPIPLN